MKKINFFIKLTFLTMSIIVLNSCELKKMNQNNDFYYIRAHQKRIGNIVDTVRVNRFLFHQNGDTLIDVDSFYFDGSSHELRIYKNNNQSQDGGYILYELDTLGIVFYTSLYWISSKKMITTNKKLNSLLEFTFFRILYYNSKYIIKHFIEPKKIFNPNQKF